MFSTANFSKIMPCFLFLHQHNKQEQIPVYDQFYQSSYSPTCSHTSEPRTAVLPQPGGCYPLQGLLCPQQHHSPALAESAQMHATGRSKTWGTHMKWPARTIQPQRRCGCSDWVETHPAVEPVQNWKVAGQGRGNRLKWDQGTGSTSLSGERNSLPLPQQPRATVESVGKGCDLL